MKRIGICAITAPGAIMCYQAIIEHVNSSELLDNPEIVIFQANLTPFKKAWINQNTDLLTDLLIQDLRKLESNNVDHIVIPSNTMHYVIDNVKESISTPIYSILDVTSEFIIKNNYENVLFLGTKWTLEGGLYDKLAKSYGYRITYPSSEDINIINKFIENELVYFDNLEEVENKLLMIVEKYKDSCDAIALACTELPLVIKEENSPLPIIDTTKLLGAYMADKTIT
ncbi:aspartate/glutamate racemase family protein [Francisella sp. SYW-9]|uniref:aspartate/glutamate racemase family protein n=1 Tax=Francisella sp. SYW-9 TaxID=2610888 RepID=UPI00123D3F36|nr:amino acid racemase [Francisella sp. SYW-9]